MQNHSTLNDCLSVLESTIPNAIDLANNAYNSETYKTALNKMRICLEVICKAIIFDKSASDAVAVTTIGRKDLNNLIKTIGDPPNQWLGATPTANDDRKAKFDLVRTVGNGGSHDSPPLPYTKLEDCKVEFRRITEWFYSTFLNGTIPPTIEAAINNAAITPEIRQEHAAMREYFNRLHAQYQESVLNEEVMTLKDVYIEPRIKFWVGCLHGTEEQYFATNLCKSISEVGFLHKFLPYFVNQKINELASIRQQKARLFLLLGYPGQGKTSFCKRLQHDFIVPENLAENALFTVRLRDITDVKALFNNPLLVLFDYINKTIDRDTNYLKQSIFDKSLLVLDGLDELAMRENSGKTEIEEFCKTLIQELKKFPNLRIVMTSRYGYVDLEKFSKHEFIVGELGRLDETQQLTWLEKYKTFHSECKLTEEKIRAINDGKNQQYKHLRELIDQPILLHLVAYADMDIDEQATRASIYNRLFEHLIERAWAKTEGQIFALNELKDSSCLREYIREIAFAIYQSEYEYIRKIDLEKLSATERFMENLGKAAHPTEALKHLMIAFYMQEVQKHEKDEEEQDKRKYAIEFLHKSLQEYLVAERIWEELKRFGEKSRNRFIIETADAALELVWNLFTPQLISNEIQEYLTQIIEADIDTNKALIFERMMHFAPQLLERHFLFKILPKLPMRGGLYAFRGYWVVLAALDGNQAIDLSGESIKDRIENSDLSFSRGKDNEDFAEMFCLFIQNIQAQKWNLRYTNLCFFVLAGVNLSGADLSGVNLSDVDLSCAYLSRTKLCNANLQNTGLCYSFIHYSDLSNSNLKGADLREANLRHTNLMNVDLSRADLRYADLTAAKNLTINQLYLVETLYETKGLAEDIVEQLKSEGYGHLFEKPKEVEIIYSEPETE